jgi:prolyl oligopeptidase
MPVDARPTVSAPDDDPYLWLEEIDGVRALTWVGEQNALTLARFGTAGFAADRDTLAAILDRPDNIPFVTRRGPYLYNIWKDARTARPLAATTLASFRTSRTGRSFGYRRARGRGKRGLDWHGASITAGDARPGDPVSVARGQRRDRSREFDIAAKTFVMADSPTAAKGGTAWLDRDHCCCPAYGGPGMATTSGYSRTVRLWRRGTERSERPFCMRRRRTRWGWGLRRPHAKCRDGLVRRGGLLLRCRLLAGDPPAEDQAHLPTDVHLKSIAIGSR